MRMTFFDNVVVTVMSTCAFFLVDMVVGYFKTLTPKRAEKKEIFRRYE